MITLTYDQILQVIGSKELDIIALKMRVAELEKQLEGELAQAPAQSWDNDKT